MADFKPQVIVGNNTDQAVPVKLINGRDLLERIAREGDMYIDSRQQENLIWGGENSGLGTPGVGNRPKPTKCLFLQTMVISSSKDIYAYVVMGDYQFVDGGNPGGSAPLSGYMNIHGSVSLVLNMIFKRDRAPAFAIVQNVNDQSHYKNIAIAKFSTFDLQTAKSSPTKISTGKYWYNITVTNNSGAATSGTLTLTELLPSGLRLLATTGSGWTVSESNGVITATTTDVIANAGTKVLRVDVATKEALTLAVTVAGYFVDNDVNYDAPAGWINGTSISEGVGPTEAIYCYSTLLRNYIRDVKGVLNRIVNKAISGSQSTQHERLRAYDNRYDAIDIPLYAIFEHAANDSGQGIPTATTIANMTAYIKHWRRYSANMPIFILSPTPLSNTTTHALQVALDTALRNAVTALRATDKNVFYSDGNVTSWNPVTESATYTIDGTHPNNAGNAKIYDNIVSTINANNITFK